MSSIIAESSPAGSNPSTSTCPRRVAQLPQAERLGEPARRVDGEHHGLAARARRPAPRAPRPWWSCRPRRSRSTRSPACRGSSISASTSQRAPAQLTDPLLDQDLGQLVQRGDVDAVGAAPAARPPAGRPRRAARGPAARRAPGWRARRSRRPGRRASSAARSSPAAASPVRTRDASTRPPAAGVTERAGSRGGRTRLTITAPAAGRRRPARRPRRGSPAPASPPAASPGARRCPRSAAAARRRRSAP